MRKGPSFLYIVYGKPTSLNDFLVMISASEENPASCGRSFPTSLLSQTAWLLQSKLKTHMGLSHHFWKIPLPSVFALGRIHSFSSHLYLCACPHVYSSHPHQVEED